MSELRSTTRVLQVSAGVAHALARTMSGTLYSWGDPTHGLVWPLYREAVLGCRDYKKQRAPCHSKWNDVYDAETTWLPGRVDTAVRFRSVCAAHGYSLAVSDAPSGAGAAPDPGDVAARGGVVYSWGLTRTGCLGHEPAELNRSDSEDEDDTYGEVASEEEMSGEGSDDSAEDAAAALRLPTRRLVGEEAKVRETCRPHRKVEGLCRPCVCLGGVAPLGGVDGIDSFTQVAGGHSFAAALSSGGQIWMWGKQLGVLPATIGATAALINQGPAHLPCPAVAFAEIAAGGSSLVARAADGRVFTFAGGTPMVELPLCTRDKCKFKKQDEVKLVEAGRLVGWAEPSSLAERCVAAVAAALARGNAEVCVQTLILVDRMDVPALSAVIPACVVCAMEHHVQVEEAAASGGLDLERALRELQLA
jgi:hypothetical protein